MATDKKHIAVYLAPEVEQALIAFCKEKGLKSKKGTMYSAGVNAVLAEFFGIADTDVSNIPNNTGNIPSNTPSETIAVEVLPPEEAVAHSAIYGFTSEEALADAHFQINMLEANYDELEDRYESAKAEVAKLRSQLETVQAIPSVTVSPEIELPEAADLLNRLKAKRKKSAVTLADVEFLLKLLEG